MTRGADAYSKWVYWLDPETKEDEISRYSQDKRLVYRARRQPCEALYARREVSIVPPEAWDRQCLRQGSWYRASAKRGQVLLVSNREQPQIEPWGRITIEAFSPPRLASEQDVLEAMGDEKAIQLLPDGWGNFSAWEVEAIRAYLGRQGIELPLEALFLYYSANHLNFAFPKFFVETSAHGPAPYSIQRTPLVCSACVELFGILGEEHPLRYLVPCPGLKYVEAAPGQYFRVEQVR